MDGSRFDDLTRSLAAGGDRRRFVRGLAAGLAGALTLGGRPAGAAPGGGGGKAQGRCPSDWTNCRGKCVFLPADPDNCGACAVVCPEGWVCDAGACRCPAGRQLCGDRCVPACAPGEVMDEETCACACPPPTSCCACLGGSSPFCSIDGYATVEECLAACRSRNPDFGFAQFGAQAVTTYTCAPELICFTTCQA